MNNQRFFGLNPRRRTWTAWGLLLGWASLGASAAEREAPPVAMSGNPLNGSRAFSYLEQVCDLGPRPSGSPAMARQQDLLEEHFEPLGGQVSRQSFLAPHPLKDAKIKMTNLVVEWRPEARERILLCAHYDTRPLPDQDPNPRARRAGRFLGANDGASGVAVLMELAHLMQDYKGPLGVDFALFDGEEFVYREKRDPYFLGSIWFSRKYKARKADFRYRWGVLLDMVGDKDLTLYQERNSVRWKDTRPLVNEIWATADRLGVKEFIPRVKREVLDDHLPLHNTAKIPTCDVIDFDYPYWHTEADTPRNCSGESLAKVGWVVWEWLQSQTVAPKGTAP